MNISGGNMPINKELIRLEIEKLNQHIKRIEAMDIVESDVENDQDVQDLLSFRIQQMVEKCIDIGSHIIANETFETAETARTIFEVLSKQGIISSETAEHLGQAVGMRNIIVHQYDEVDVEKLYKAYEVGINDVKDFVKSIVRLV